MGTVQRKFLISRRYGISLWGQSRDPVVDRKYPPGQHGVMGYVKKSDYAKQLESKQKLKFHYNLRESQFRKIYYDAIRKRGDRIENFIGALESRLDVIVYRAKIAPTIFAARQMVSHCHFLLDEKKVNIPSMLVSAGSTIQLKQKMFDNPTILQAIESEERKIPEYLEVDKEKRTIKILQKPTLEETPYPFIVDVDFINHIIAYYSH